MYRRRMPKKLKFTFSTPAAAAAEAAKALQQQHQQNHIENKWNERKTKVARDREKHTNNYYRRHSLCVLSALGHVSMVSTNVVL